MGIKNLHPVGRSTGRNLSGDGIDSEDEEDDVSSLILDRKQKHLHRRVAFYAGWIVVLAITAALLFWLFCPSKSLIDAFKSDASKSGSAAVFITPAIILASFACLLALGLLRFAFQSDNGDKDDGEVAPMWYGLAKEVVGVFREWVSKK